MENTGIDPWSRPRRRRALVSVLAGGLIGMAALVGARAAPGLFLIEVWKAPTCGCCKDWIRHLEANSFQVKVHDTGNTAVRARLGIPIKLGSCHTAQVEGFVIEGHVSAREIRRLLLERPNAIGLAVPGMPLGSPGMDGGVYSGRKEPYDVLLIHKDSTITSYQTYR